MQTSYLNSPDPARPDPNILLTRSKKEPDPLFTWVLFFIRWEKIKKFEIFRGNFSNPNTNQRWLTHHLLILTLRSFWLILHWNDLLWRRCSFIWDCILFQTSAFYHFLFLPQSGVRTRVAGIEFWLETIYDHAPWLVEKLYS